MNSLGELEGELKNVVKQNSSAREAETERQQPTEVLIQAEVELSAREESLAGKVTS